MDLFKLFCFFHQKTIENRLNIKDKKQQIICKNQNKLQLDLFELLKKLISN